MAVHPTSGGRYGKPALGLSWNRSASGWRVCLPKLSQKSDTTAAVKYALGRWEALTRYAEDGGLEIDNNAAERALRAVALGRKNYLFAGSDRGGERAATLYSLIGTAKLNNLDPESYLRDVLSRLPDHPISRNRRWCCCRRRFSVLLNFADRDGMEPDERAIDGQLKQGVEPLGMRPRRSIRPSRYLRVVAMRQSHQGAPRTRVRNKARL